MSVFFVAAAIVAGFLLLVACYWVLLAARYPEEVRSNEIFYLQTEDLWKLRLCRFRKDETSGPPVLLVHGMGANQNNFTCPPGRCLADFLKDHGIDCWTIDLRGAKSSLPAFERNRNEVHLEDFLKQDLPAAVQFILKTTGSEKLHWVGHSMGGMLLYAYGELFGCGQIASGVTLGSPLDFNDVKDNLPPGLLYLAERFPALSGNVVRGIIPLLKVLGIRISAFPINMDNLPEGIHAGHFMNMLEDPLPSLMHQVNAFIERQEYKLDNGGLDVTAELSKLSFPLLAFYAVNDPFVDPPRARELFDTIGAAEKQYVLCAKENGFAEDYSHVDLAFSRESITEIYAPILKWILDHPGAEAQPKTAALSESAVEAAVSMSQAAPTKTRTARRKPTAKAESATSEGKAPAAKKASVKAVADAPRTAAAKSSSVTAKPKPVAKPKPGTKPKAPAKARTTRDAAATPPEPNTDIAPPVTGKPAPSAKKRTRKPSEITSDATKAE